MSRVSIEPVQPSDEAELIAGHLASVGLHHPWVQPFTDAEGFAAYLAEIDSGEKVGIIAREKHGGSIIGVLNLSQIFRKGFQNAYLGYYAMAGQDGRGLMTEAVRHVVRHAFDDLELHRLEANVQPDNERSIALLKRAGFRKEGFSPRYLRIDGIWRDHERWAILSDEVAQ